MVMAQCALCRNEPDETVNATEFHLAHGALRQVGDGDLDDYISYYEREKLEGTDWVHHFLNHASAERERRQRLQKRGGPMFQSGRGPEWIKAIKDAVDMNDLAYALGRDPLTARSRKAVPMLCPLHADHKPSAVIYQAEKRWWCFVCNQGGDCFDLVEACTGLSWPEALRWLADWAHVIPPKQAPKPRTGPPAPRRRPPAPDTGLDGVLR